MLDVASNTRYGDGQPVRIGESGPWKGFPGSRSRLASIERRVMTAQQTDPPMIIGGPAAGRCVAVEIIAGHLPLFLGLCGGNYVLDRGYRDAEMPPVYLHWPLGAPEPGLPSGLR
jgi:hypothetical protein